MAHKRLHATTKGQVEVNSDTGGGHATRRLAVEKSHLNRQSKHVGQRQAEIPPCLGDGHEQADITLIEVKDKAVLVEDAKRPLQSFAILRAELLRWGDPKGRTLADELFMQGGYAGLLRAMIRQKLPVACGGNVGREEKKKDGQARIATRKKKTESRPTKSRS